MRNIYNMSSMTMNSVSTVMFSLILKHLHAMEMAAVTVAKLLLCCDIIKQTLHTVRFFITIFAQYLQHISGLGIS